MYCTWYPNEEGDIKIVRAPTNADTSAAIRSSTVSTVTARSSSPIKNSFLDFAYNEEDGEEPSYSTCRHAIAPSTKRPIRDTGATKAEPRKKQKIAKKEQKEKIPTDLMKNWWTELKSLTTNYPFAVLITGVLGSQARDVVTVAALKRIAVLTNNDISPRAVSSLKFYVLEDAIKTVNYCNKKTHTILTLSNILISKEVPRTVESLCLLPGITFFINCICYSCKTNCRSWACY